ncbi:DNA cytosine methyltransferase [Thalassomonas haliotis]|uniref:Cytosine-specific methyltransferase n=1 Tax=Thalassomonas haliotis TaxID=485448 RepID=A0ABY7V8U2_9GAMM|nr:DNA cytosine methyltransferase [Thalassomonas haliotis]WDE09735.1 DNA cytosine methyltransferase [Thalassomonas haliotis]
MKEVRSAVSLFSGAGGMDVGFANAGFDTVFANDIDKAACDTFNLNHSITSLCGDLRDYRDSISQFKGVDLVFGGPPCQGFSVAGKMDPDDERSQLIWSFFDKVELLKPRAFVCENVKALAVNSRWSQVLDGLIEKSNALGYTTALLVLNASNYGVPQARERMFLVGIREGGSKVSSLAFKSALTASLDAKKESSIVIADLIRGLGPAGSERNSRTCSAIITYAKNPVLRKSPYAGMLFNGAGRPINPNGVALTLAASMGGNKTPIVDEAEIFNGKASYVTNYHQQLLTGATPRTGTAPSRLRRITIDEALAIQSFPYDYKMVGSQSAMYRQIGNAVPCRLAEVVARTVDEVLTMGLKKFVSVPQQPNIKI